MIPHKAPIRIYHASGGNKGFLCTPSTDSDDVIHLVSKTTAGVDCPACRENLRDVSNLKDSLMLKYVTHEKAPSGTGTLYLCGAQPEQGVVHGLARERGEAVDCPECIGLAEHGFGEEKTRRKLDPTEGPEQVNRTESYPWDERLQRMDPTRGPEQLERASARQMGGDHYRTLKVQPWEALDAWMTPEQWHGYLLGTAIHYLSRAGKKGGFFEDVDKASHVLERLLEERNG